MKGRLIHNRHDTFTLSNLYELFHPREVQLGPIAQISPEIWQEGAIGSHQELNRTLTDVQGGHVGEKVVSHKETHEDEIVQGTLEVKL